MILCREQAEPKNDAPANRVELFLADLQVEVLRPAIRSAPTRQNRIESFGRDRSDEITLGPDFRCRTRRERILKESIVMSLQRIRPGSAERHNDHQLRISLVRFQYDDRPSFHDFRLDVTEEIARQYSARFGLVGQSHVDVAMQSERRATVARESC